MARRFGVSMIERMFFSGLFNYPEMSEEEKRDRRALYEMSDLKTKRRLFGQTVKLTRGEKPERRAAILGAFTPPSLTKRERAAMRKNHARELREIWG